MCVQRAACLDGLQCRLEGLGSPLGVGGRWGEEEMGEWGGREKPQGSEDLPGKIPALGPDSKTPQISYQHLL